MATVTGLEVDITLKRFPAVADAPARCIFKEFRLSVAPGEFVCLLGPSGVGKTTLLNIVAGLDRDFSGQVAIEGRTRPRIAYVFQSPRLLPWRTVLDNVLLALPTGGAALKFVGSMLADMGLSDALNVYPDRLSLGMQRRVALARAFATDPDILLMDEPLVSLDEVAAGRMRELLIGMLSRRPATVLFVTHDSRDAVRLGDRIVVLSGSPARITRDVSVGCGRGERQDEAAVDILRRNLLTESKPDH